MKCRFSDGKLSLGYTLDGVFRDVHVHFVSDIVDRRTSVEVPASVSIEGSKTVIELNEFEIQHDYDEFTNFSVIEIRFDGKETKIPVFIQQDRNRDLHFEAYM